MKTLKVNWSDLETAFEKMGGDFAFMNDASNHFDTETGQVIVIDDVVLDAMSPIVDEIREATSDEAVWDEQDVHRTPSFETLEDWLKPTVLLAIEMEYGDHTDRFETIPKFDSHDAFEWMEAFVETIIDATTRERLAAALQKRKPFRQFRDAIGSDRKLQQDWRAFESAARREFITRWLDSIDVKPLNSEDSITSPSTLPDLRRIMFAEVRWFVGLAGNVPGVERIALVGSLATAKEVPKDVDLLVTIADDCDLTELASLGRKLAGHLASHSSGADVFLANSKGDYLGRTCSWKECRPGIRASCDALSCGVRQYLHDDLGSIRLKSELIMNPPATLWPQAFAGQDIPHDVREQLIDVLASSSS